MISNEQRAHDLAIVNVKFKLDVSLVNAKSGKDVDIDII